jgi:hypothetical protein
VRWPASAHRLTLDDAAEFGGFKLWSLNHAQADVTSCRRISRHRVSCSYSDYLSGDVTCNGRFSVYSTKAARFRIHFYGLEDCYGPGIDREAVD